MDFFGIGPLELLLIAVVAFLLLGPGKLQEVARGLGKTIREFRKYSSALGKTLTEEIEKETKLPLTQKESSMRSDETPAGSSPALTEAKGANQSANGPTPTGK